MRAKRRRAWRRHRRTGRSRFARRRRRPSRHSIPADRAVRQTIVEGVRPTAHDVPHRAGTAHRLPRRRVPPARPSTDGGASGRASVSPSGSSPAERQHASKGDLVLFVASARTSFKSRRRSRRGTSPASNCGIRHDHSPDTVDNAVLSSRTSAANRTLAYEPPSKSGASIWMAKRSASFGAIADSCRSSRSTRPVHLTKGEAVAEGDS